MKKIIKLLLLIVIISMTYVNSVLAYDIGKDDKIYVSGAPIGIKLNTGVTIAGTYGISYKNNIYKPWSNAHITESDVIISYNNTEVSTMSDLEKALIKSNGDEAKIVVLRSGKRIETKITPLTTDRGYSLGLYIKDNIMGIGTLTYYVKEANIFGSLGHSITDYSLNSGEIYDATITNIVKPRGNEAGEKEATISNKAIGFIKINSSTGVQGEGKQLDTSKMECLNFKLRNEINCGDAEIWTCINGTKIEKYKIEITALENQKSKKIKGISFKVTDEKLLETCGGIVQGMSGSPIVQDNKIIGAVTHVSVNNPKQAYGIYLEWMFEDMNISVKKGPTDC